jgi:NADP-dependent 3-hydroxy acid dehydrogenase YdfG
MGSSNHGHDAHRNSGGAERQSCGLDGKGQRRTISGRIKGSVIDVNIKGVLYGIAAVLPYMKQQKAGHIISVSSVAGHKVHAGGAVYSATKYAVRALSEGLRQEVKPYNIRTTVISPGAVATELPNSITESDVLENIHKFYEKMAIPAESFARAVAFAMSQPEEVDVNEILFRPTRQEL